VAKDEQSVEQIREERRHDEWLSDFRSYFGSRAWQALRGDDAPGEWPFVMARPLEWSTDSDALAEFVAGVLIAPTPRSSSEPWQVRGLLYRDPKGPPVVGDVIVEHFPIRQAARVEVTGTVLRRVNLREIYSHAVAGLEGVLLARKVFNVTEDRMQPARRAVSEAAKPKRGRPGYPDEHYRRIAERYLELLSTGRLDVLVALAAEESRPRETVRDWVRKATERGYLAPGKPGRAEARPGPKLKRKGT
jgi:hypothetical protein